MNKSHKTLFIFLIIILLCYNLHNSFLTFYCNVFHENLIKEVFIRAIPLFILLICYFSNIRHSPKLSINRTFLVFSIFIFAMIEIHKLLYFYLLIDNMDNTFLLFMNLLFVFFMVLTFFKNFKRGESIMIHLCFIWSIFFILQLFYEIKTFSITDFYTYTNPNRYEFVKYHYFSDSEFSYLPDKIPEDATNIIFHYDDPFISGKDLYLEYDSPSISNENHHARYHIVLPKM